MTDNYASKLKQTLTDCISEVNNVRHLFCKNPKTDFTRSRKMPLTVFLQLMIQIQSKSLPNEVMDYFGHAQSCPSVSAFTQQRDKFLPEGWGYLIHLFMCRSRSLLGSLFNGYRVLACDGSDVNIARNPDDERTFIHEGERGYNAIHVNALYDIVNHVYTDCVVQGKKKLHERSALNMMVDRYADSVPAILLADRGYESFNVFAHCIRKGICFAIRMKDIGSNGILSAHDLPDEEFDTQISTTLTRRHTRETTNHPETYTILSPATDFDDLDEEHKYYHIGFRVVRIAIGDGKYVCLATNLPSDTFTLEKLKILYRLRWGEETSFRELKYTIGLVNWHGKKYDAILQELYARIILYNFCQMVTSHAVVCTRKKTKHSYRINFATAVNICKAYLRSGGDEKEVMQLIQRHLTPIRNDRIYPINLKPKRNRDFVYRAA